MSEPGDFILVHFVQKPTTGLRFEKKRQAWPLHITLVPWFSDVSIELLEKNLESGCQRLQPFELVVGGTHYFSPETHVNLVTDQQKIKHLHLTLLTFVKKAGGKLRNKRYVAEHFNAHITRHEVVGEWCEEGTKLEIADVHLVRLEPNNICVVAERYPLGELS